MVFCNFEKDITYPKNIWVTILILIDGFLQCVHNMSINIEQICHNPYFNRWFSAICSYCREFHSGKWSQSLF